MTANRLSRREFLRTSAIAATGLLAAACVPAASPSASSVSDQGDAPSGDMVSVSFMVPGSANEDADFAPVFDAFNEMYNEQGIEGEYAPAGTGYGPQYNDKLLTMLAGGTAPDSFKTLFGFFGSLADSGVYVPLDEYIDSNPDETQFDDFFDAHVEACRFNGKMQALPNDGAPFGLWYNADLYDANSQAYPDWDTTWDDLLTQAGALTAEEGGITTQHGMGHPRWNTWIWSNGGQVINEEGTKCLLDSPEAVEALTYMQDVVNLHGVAPGPEALSELGMSDRFKTGKLGSMVGTRGALGGLRSIEEFAFDAAPVPLSPKGTRMTQLAIGWTSIWSQSEHPDETYLLAAWICSQEGQRLRISRGFAHPSRKSLVEQDWYKNYECPKCNSHGTNTIFPEMLQNGEAMAWPAHAKESEIVQAINSQLDFIWDGTKPADQVAQDMTSQIDEIIQG